MIRGVVTSLTPGTPHRDPALSRSEGASFGAPHGPSVHMEGEPLTEPGQAIGPPEASRRHRSSSPTSPNEPELRRGLWHVTYPDRRLCFSARSPPLTPLTGWLASPLS
ncbi:unnamed protein product [Pleuronectes platessa]|uniref:Uncharacterized protein n=1 Tax=Pleuronectes platessa TaxID=8262 RepID=A0A9N7V216_PLEPL|nr:unnamed protein product [Pleuronectes platessa]